MILLKLMIPMVLVHIGLGFTGLSASYLGGVGDVGEESPGVSSWLLTTPLKTFIDLDAPPALEEAARGEDEEGPAGVVGQIAAIPSFLGAITGMVGGLAILDYGLLNDIPPDSAWYLVVLAAKFVSFFMSVAVLLGLAKLIFDSGMLSTTAGLVGLGIISGGTLLGVGNNIFGG